MMPLNEVKERALKEDQERLLNAVRYIIDNRETHRFVKISKIENIIREFRLDWPK